MDSLLFLVQRHMRRHRRTSLIHKRTCCAVRGIDRREMSAPSAVEHVQNGSVGGGRSAAAHAIAQPQRSRIATIVVSYH